VPPQAESLREPAKRQQLLGASLRLALRASRWLFQIAPDDLVAHLRQRFAGDGKIVRTVYFAAGL